MYILISILPNIRGKLIASEDGQVWIHASCFAKGYKPEEEPAVTCFRCGGIFVAGEEMEMKKNGVTFVIHRKCAAGGKRKLDCHDT